MRLFAFLFTVIFFLQCASTSKKENGLFNAAEAKKALTLAGRQYENMISTVPDSLLPRNTEPNGEIRFVKPWDWTSGFYPGILWYLYEYTDDNIFKSEAIRSTALLENEKHNGSSHDLGFMLYCSFGNGLRIDSTASYRATLLTGAKTLSSRFNDNVGCIKSWDWAKQWQFPVIVDNMMNLEYLFWASKATGDSTYYRQAVSHADHTIANHYRLDFSTYHVVNYDSETGEVLDKKTLQGYADDSNWARGQAWGLYGYTMMYRETRKIKYLKHAQGIADFLFHQPNLPDDFIPYWDFDAPDIPNAPRDASAAAIIAAALLELQDYVDDKTKIIYLLKAEKILQSLSSEKYHAKTGENNNFILKHSVGHLPGNSEIDTPIIYADFYYIEALLRYLDIKHL